MPPETDAPDGRLARRAAALPREPGVYLFMDGRGKVLYVGKAKDLRARVRQYVSGADERYMVRFLVHAAADVEVVVTRTEKEALILENTLIKKHQPRYNTKLVDDSSFLHLRIDPAGTWPRYELVRRIRDTRARHFGPYHSASRARQTLEFLNRRFPLRTCSDRELESRRRPCLLHQMHRCLAPCVGLCSSEEYQSVVQESMLFLEGRSSELLVRLRSRMQAQSEALAFEDAARTRDLVAAIEASIERQHVVDRKLGDRDAWGLCRGEGSAVAALLQVREGLMQEALVFPLQGALGDDGDVLSSLLNTWYGDGERCPAEVLLPVEPADMAALTEVLAERRGRAVAVRLPQKGDKLRLVELATENARQALALQSAREDRQAQAMRQLMEICRLPRLPRRIECFDNSNIQGADPVASMVVFTDGRPDRAAYRRYKVKSVEGSDDFATMREILARRYRRALGLDSEGAALPAGEDGVGVMPDLLVVDGGKGQLGAALAVLADLGLHDLPAIGLSKPRTEHRRGEREATDKIVLPDARDPIRLPHNSPALNLLQALRDESHRTAVGYHRKVRSRRTLQSRLDDLPGVGEARRKALLAHFGSLQAVRAASAEQIAEVPGFGPRLAARVVDALRES